MGSRQIKALFGGIFGHFLLRIFVIQLLSALLIIGCMLPYFSQWMTQMQREQGNSIAQALIAATHAAISGTNTLSLETYTKQLLQRQPDIRYVVFNLPKQQDMAISQQHVIKQRQNLPFLGATDLRSTQTLVSHSQFIPTGLPLNVEDQFLFSTTFNSQSNAIGRISVAYRNQSFFSLMQAYFAQFALVLLGSVCLGLFLFFLFSRKIRQQIHTFSYVARQLSRGELTTRAPEKAIGEISLLSKSVNKMASNLEAQSKHLTRMAQMVAQTNDAFVLFDHGFNFSFANAALQKLTGYSAQAFEQADLKSFANTLQLDIGNLKQALLMMQVNMSSAFNQDILLTRRDGHTLHVHCRLEQIYDDETDIEHYLLVLSDISQRKSLERELHSLAYFDKLTGLPNRRMFIDYLVKRIKKAERTPCPFALFFMDLDDFKNINDTMGHEAGDVLLQQVAKRLKEIFRSTDLVARLGGDEFIVLIENTNAPDPVDLALLAGKAIQMLSSHPIVLNGRALTIGTSIGIALYPDNGVDTDSLVKNADTAMYAAKKSGKNNYAFYNESMNIALREYLEIETDLKSAILAHDQLQLHYQPIVDLHNKHMVGVEVLARWLHPTKGVISPSKFINVAEKTDLILTLSERLLNQAFRQAKTWQSRGFKHYVSVNISVRQFEKPNFINMLTSLILDYEVDPSKLQLEFTEGVMLDHSDITFEKFEAIKSLGFRVAIDDFGTGYSSLSYIHKLPIDVIKIDQAFVANLLNNEKSQAILSAITQLCNQLGIQTIAEGIELNTHETLLIECECQYGQGYLYDASMLLHQLEDKYLPLFPEESLAFAEAEVTE